MNSGLLRPLSSSLSLAPVLCVKVLCGCFCFVLETSSKNINMENYTIMHAQHLIRLENMFRYSGQFTTYL